MSEFESSQDDVNLSDGEYEDFLVQINDIMQQQDGSSDPDLRQHMVSLDHHVQQQLEQQRAEIKRLDVAFHQQMKVLEDHQHACSQQHRQQLHDFEHKLFTQWQVSEEKAVESMQVETKHVQNHLTGELHNLQKLFNKNALEMHEEKSELKKDIELLQHALTQSEKRIAAGMRSHHVWVTLSIIAALAMYKVIEVMLLSGA